MVYENLEKTGCFTTLFNDFWGITKKTKSTGQLFKVNPANYGYLGNYASKLQEALDAEYRSLPDVNSLYKMFRYFWAFSKQFVNCMDSGPNGRSDEYWELLCSAANSFYSEFPYDFAKKMVLAFLDEMESRGKYELEQARMSA